MAKLIKQVTKEEEKIIVESINASMSVSTDLTRGLMDGHCDLRDTCYHAPSASNKAGNFNYIPNHYFAGVYIAARNIGAKSIIDLGAGLSLGLAAIAHYERQFLSSNQIKLGGIEIHEPLCRLVKRTFNINIKHKNLLFLEEGDIKDYDMIYMYEPIHDSKIAREFINRLVPLVNPSQTIALVSTGNMSNCLNNHPDITTVKGTSQVILYKKKAHEKTTTIATTRSEH